MALIPLISPEAASALEPERSGLAGRCLITRLCRHIKTEQESYQIPQRIVADFFRELLQPSSICTREEELLPGPGLGTPFEGETVDRALPPLSRWS